MLQVASGKLFKEPPARQNELRGVLYTNLRIYREDTIITAGGRLLPVATINHTKGVVYEITEQMEDPPGVGVLVSRTLEPYLNEFAAVASFALDITCTPDPYLTDRLISARRGLSTGTSQRLLVSRVFDEEVWCKDEDVAFFTDFVSQLVGLERRAYLAAVRSIKNYVTAMHRMADDLELSYTLFVAALESLTQEFDGHKPQWADMDRRKRGPIDDALADMSDEAAGKLRDAILETEHVSLARRFRDFTLDHIEPDFFRSEAVSIAGPISRIDLVPALNEAYSLRSRYVHNLQKLPKILGYGDMGEIVQVEHVPTLTFRGLARLTRHVILQFVTRGQKIDHEPHAYHLETPGIITLPMAPEYWIWKTEGLTQKHANRRLDAFLQQLSTLWQDAESKGLTDLSGVMGWAEKNFGQMEERYRRPFFALYVLYYCHVSPELKSPQFENIYQKFKADVEGPTIHGLICLVTLNLLPDWPLETTIRLAEQYFDQRDQPKGLKIPKDFEAGITLYTAEICRRDANESEMKRWLSRTVDVMPGTPQFIELEMSATLETELQWRRLIFPTRFKEADELLRTDQVEDEITE